MKFNLEKKDIDSALLSLSAVADKKQTLPVLSNILIKAQENGLNMLSTDLEIELEMDVENVVVEEPGEITIPAKKASDIVKELPDGNISFSLEEGEKFKIKTPTGEYNLVTMEASCFPEFSSTEIDNAHEINSEELILFIFIYLIIKSSASISKLIEFLEISLISLLFNVILVPMPAFALPVTTANPVENKL